MIIFPEIVPLLFDENYLGVCSSCFHKRIAGFVCWDSTMTHIWHAAKLESPTQTSVCPGFDGQTKTLMGGTLGFVHSALYPCAPCTPMLEYGVFCIVSEGKHWGNTLSIIQTLAKNNTDSRGLSHRGRERTEDSLFKCCTTQQFA